ncbi:MAG: ACT domain-containing protein, partial [Firmicutes bacterium]|nr:ACT domain-containing protein [Bacillota bacterium]
IEVTAHDRKGLLADVMNAVAESKVNITAVNGRTAKDKTAIIHLTVDVRDRVHLEQVMNKVKKVRDVYTVRRYSGST